MANSKIHVRPNGELGRCSAKIKCDYAGEGAVHFEGPNAKQEADKFLEGISAYEHYKSVTTEELRESNPELAVAYGIDPDIAAFVEGKPNKYSDNLAEDTEQEQTPAQEQPVAEEAPIETAPAPAVEPEVVEEPAPEAEVPAKQTSPVPSTEPASVEEPEPSTADAKDNDAVGNAEAPDDEHTRELGPGEFTLWRRAYRDRLMNGEPLTPRDQVAFGTSFAIAHIIDHKLGGESQLGDNFTEMMQLPDGSIPLSMVKIRNAGIRAAAKPDYQENLASTVLELNPSTLNELDPHDPQDMPYAYAEWTEAKNRQRNQGRGIIPSADELIAHEATMQAMRYALLKTECAQEKKNVEFVSDEELKAKTANRKGDPFYHRYGFKNMDERYCQAIADRWKENLKPGAYITLGGLDSEVYRATPDGRLVTSDGKNWGAINYEYGYVVSSDGLKFGDGLRIYKSAEDLAKNSLPLGDPYHDTAIVSADPGYFSKWENDKRFQEGYKAKLESNAYKAEKGRRNHVATQALEAVMPTLDNADDSYDMLNRHFGYKNERWEQGNQGELDRRALARDISKFLTKQVDDGSIDYAPNLKTITKAHKPSLEELKPKKTVDDALGNEGTVAERASIRNAIHAKRIRLGSHREAFADTFDPRPGQYNAVSHRRRSWGEKKVPVSLAQNGNIVLTRQSYDSLPQVWVVVDKENNKMVRATDYAYPQGKLAKDAKDANDTEACPIPEEAVESIIAHYDSYGDTVETKTFDEALQGTRGESYVW